MDIFVVETKGVDFASIEKYLVCVSPARRKAVLDKAQEESRIQSLVGGLLIRSELSYRTGIPIKKLAFERGAHGKPYLKDSDTHFSLSHTNGAVCAAFSADGEIGVDIERSDRRTSEALMRKVLCDNERKTVNSDEDFIRIWVKKEAFLKRTGIGLATKLCGADTTLLPDVAAFTYGGYLIGAAGKDALNANVCVLELSDLLARFQLS